MGRLDDIHARTRPALVALPGFISILVVDDQRFDRTRLHRLIRALEIESHVVDADCLETMGTQLEIDSFDLILLDYNLPDGTGLQALNAVRMSVRNRNAATIMITGDGQTEIAIEALKRGCSDYITKDDLTLESFRRATINALQKSKLEIGLHSEDQKRQQMEAVLQRFSSECASEIKPVVSRMMRQLRQLRDARTLNAEEIADHHNRIEKSCMRLWEFLNDLEDYKGTDLSSVAFGGGSATLQHPRLTPDPDTASPKPAHRERDPFPLPDAPAPPVKRVAPKSRSLFRRTKE